MDWPRERDCETMKRGASNKERKIRKKSEPDVAMEACSLYLASFFVLERDWILTRT